MEEQTNQKKVHDLFFFDAKFLVHWHTRIKQIYVLNYLKLSKSSKSLIKIVNLQQYE